MFSLFVASSQQMKDKRLVHLEEQAMEALTASVENDLGPAVFPNAMIVGDCIITHLLGMFLHT
jgi:hypothetical protein